MARLRGIGFGIVGTGVIARFHAQAICDMRGGRLVGLFSRQGGDKAQALAQQYNVPLYVGNYAAFLTQPGLAVVTIATPSGAHLEPAVVAAQAGKHVICEKPLEVTLERCDQMIAACQRAQVWLAGVISCSGSLLTSTHLIRGFAASLPRCRRERRGVVQPIHAPSALRDIAGSLKILSGACVARSLSLLMGPKPAKP
jgi:hypothetical protein